jgi:hypothetical protein
MVQQHRQCVVAPGLVPGAYPKRRLGAVLAPAGVDARDKAAQDERWHEGRA